MSSNYRHYFVVVATDSDEGWRFSLDVSSVGDDGKSIYDADTGRWVGASDDVGRVLVTDHALSWKLNQVIKKANKEMSR